MIYLLRPTESVLSSWVVCVAKFATANNRRILKVKDSSTKSLHDFALQAPLRMTRYRLGRFLNPSFLLVIHSQFSILNSQFFNSINILFIYQFGRAAEVIIYNYSVCSTNTREPRASAVIIPSSNYKTVFVQNDYIPPENSW